MVDSNVLYKSQTVILYKAETHKSNSLFCSLVDSAACSQLMEVPDKCSVLIFTRFFPLFFFFSGQNPLDEARTKDQPRAPWNKLALGTKC